jgi:hypothetical protein
VWETCEQFAHFGVPLHFSELTVVSGQTRRWNEAEKTPWPSTTEGEAAQARTVERLYTLLFSHPAVEAITWWDFSDWQAWRHAPGGLIRNDMSPKPAYELLKKLVHGDWWTSTDASTDAAGRASLRGFLGEYRATVTAGNRSKTIAGLNLRRDAENRWELQLP